MLAEDATARPAANAQRSVLLRFRCPHCQQTNRSHVQPGESIQCVACGWSRACAAEDFQKDEPTRCLVCGCHDLWRQKDFPQRLGLLMVAAGIVFSTIAYALWYPVLALGILMFFALIDFLLFAFMRDVLVCYRCGARHGGFEPTAEHSVFQLEVAERYRQERIRLESAGRRTS